MLAVVTPFRYYAQQCNYNLPIALRSSNRLLVRSVCFRSVLFARIDDERKASQTFSHVANPLVIENVLSTAAAGSRSALDLDASLRGKR